MAEPVEVAIQKALTDRATAFAAAQGMAAAISYPNVAFIPPAAKTGTVYGKWLQVSFLPAPSFARGVDYASSNQHYGIFQLSAFMGFGSGEPAVKRIASAAAAYFKRGTIVTQDGFRATVYDTPTIASGFKDDPWWVVPVSIPFKCFAPSP